MADSRVFTYVHHHRCLPNVTDAICSCCRVGVVPLFCGHGVGKVFHASPAVMHTPNGETDVMHVRPLRRPPVRAHTSPRSRQCWLSQVLLASCGCQLDTAALLEDQSSSAQAALQLFG